MFNQGHQEWKLAGCFHLSTVPTCASAAKPELTASVPKLCTGKHEPTYPKLAQGIHVCDQTWRLLTKATLRWNGTFLIPPDFTLGCRRDTSKSMFVPASLPHR